MIFYEEPAKSADESIRLAAVLVTFPENAPTVVDVPQVDLAGVVVSVLNKALLVPESAT